MKTKIGGLFKIVYNTLRLTLCKYFFAKSTAVKICKVE